MNHLALHSEIDTEEELQLLFDEQNLDDEDYDIQEYSFSELVNSTQGYESKVARVETTGYDTVGRVESSAEKFLEWVAFEDEVIEISEAEIYADVGGKYGIEMNRAVLVDGVHPDNMREVDHPVYEELPQYFTVFGLINDEQETAEFYYKNVHPEKIISDDQEDNALRSSAESFN